MNTIQMPRLPLLSLILLVLGTAYGSAADAAPTVREAEEFIAEAEAALLESWIARERAMWVQANFITEDTDRLAADAGRRTTMTDLLHQRLSRPFDDTSPLEVPTIY